MWGGYTLGGLGRLGFLIRKTLFDPFHLEHLVVSKPDPFGALSELEKFILVYTYFEG
jgi:hypothetical protein